MGRKPAPCQGWYAAPVPTETPGLLRAPGGQHDLRRFRVIPVISLRIAKRTAQFLPVHSTAFRWLSSLYRLRRSSCRGTMLDGNGHSAHQGFGGIWVPHALGISGSTRHSCSVDTNG